MFQFTGFAPLAGCHAFSMAGCPIRIPADQIVCADPRGFSQLIASFVASGSLGIPHTPLSSLSPDLLYCSPRPQKKGPGRGPSPGPPVHRTVCCVSFSACAKTWILCAPCPNMSMNFFNVAINQFVNVAIHRYIDKLLYCYINRGEYRSRTDGLLRARQAL